MARFVTAGAGFLLAVLWFDLMYDVQVIGHREGSLPESVLESIGRYYRRVTTDARPMNRLVALSMLATLTALETAGRRYLSARWRASSRPVRGSCSPCSGSTSCTTCRSSGTARARFRSPCWSRSAAITGA